MVVRDEAFTSQRGILGSNVNIYSSSLVCYSRQMSLTLTAMRPGRVAFCFVGLLLIRQNVPQPPLLLLPPSAGLRNLPLGHAKWDLQCTLLSLRLRRCKRRSVDGWIYE